jgi:hypothetical protein
VTGDAARRMRTRAIRRTAVRDTGTPNRYQVPYQRKSARFSPG